MRTTLNIDDDVLAAAKALAALQRRSIGGVISALARQALKVASVDPQARNGVPLLPLRSGILAVVTPALVKQLHDEWS